MWIGKKADEVKLPGLFVMLIPSGKRLHSYGKSPFLMGKSTIDGHFQ